MLKHSDHTYSNLNLRGSLENLIRLLGTYITKLDIHLRRRKTKAFRTSIKLRNETT